MARAWIGTSGYIYPHWEGIFYPAGLPESRWLEFYAERFSTVELNVTFYRLPSVAAFQGWYKRTPRGFTFAVKGSRFITHVKRLKEVREPLKLFISRAKALKEKLGVVLWQFPPQFKLAQRSTAEKKKSAEAKRRAEYIGRLEDFLKLLETHRPIRQVFEFRDQSWFGPEVAELFSAYGYPFCLADWPDLSVPVPIVGDFLYLRRHGAGSFLYGGCYTKKQLSQDAQTILAALRQGRSVFVYFNNDENAYAAQNALTLKQMLS